MDTATFVITSAALGVVLLGAFWKFSVDQGKQTQLILNLVQTIDQLRTEVRLDIERGSSRMDRIETKVDAVRSDVDKQQGQLNFIRGTE